MKKIKITIYCALAIFTLGSCIKNKNAGEEKSEEAFDERINIMDEDTIVEDIATDSVTSNTERLEADIPQESSKPYTSVEQMPQFVGGDAALLKFLKENLKFPVGETPEGRVVVRFVIDQNGDIQEPTVIRSLSAATNKEALRVIELMPRWTPGKQNGKTVSVYFTLPVQFQK